MPRRKPKKDTRCRVRLDDDVAALVIKVAAANTRTVTQQVNHTLRLWLKAVTDNRAGMSFSSARSAAESFYQ